MIWMIYCCPGNLTSQFFTTLQILTFLIISRELVSRFTTEMQNFKKDNGFNLIYSIQE